MFKLGGNDDCPCNGCMERHAECHAKCERYVPWQKARQQEYVNRRDSYLDVMSDERKKRLWRDQRYSRRRSPRGHGGER